MEDFNVNKNKLVQILIETKAFQFNFDRYFEWSSGMKSPFYCDHRLLMSYPEFWSIYMKEFSSFITHSLRLTPHLLKKNPITLAATATAGIPHGAYLACILKKPLLYVRSQKKEHGKQKLIEGHFEKNQNVIIIEDLISTGKSTLNVYKTLKEHQLNTLCAFSLFSYNLNKAKKAFQSYQLKKMSLLTFDDLILSLREQNLLTEQKTLKLKEFHQELNALN